VTASRDIEEALAAVQSVSDSAWLVGGAVRDRLLGRPTTDYDVAVAGDVQRAARAAARAAYGHAFELSEGFGGWRVVPRRDRRVARPDGHPGPAWQLDVLPVLHGSIEADLGLRDFTINALAQPLDGDGELIDPFGGRRDLEERELRVVSSQAFERDPLRSLRLARLACEIGFDIEPETVAAARQHARLLERVSPERIFEELRRILTAPDALRGLEWMDTLGITEVVLPELWRLHGIEQSRYHHLDVHDHTMSVLAEAIELERAPERHLGPRWQEVDAVLRTPLANQLTRWQALRFGALLHDIAKPQTRGVSPEGRVTFMGHDAAGAQTAVAILARLRSSQRLREYVSVLVRNHLRLGFLVHERPLSRRSVYIYLKGLGEFAVDVTVLSVADRLSTRGDRSTEAIAEHVELAREMLGHALSWRADPPRPPVRGDELAQALGLTPGPALGEILAELEQDSFTGEIGSPEQAIERARQLLDRRRGQTVDR
jgi:putative nucleotidyltransferase with HDIG domain